MIFQFVLPSYNDHFLWYALSQHNIEQVPFRIEAMIAGFCVSSSQRMATCPRGPPSGLALHRSHSFPSRKARIRSSEAGSMASFAFLQFVLDAPGLIQRSLLALHDLLRQNYRVSQVVRINTLSSLIQK